MKAIVGKANKAVTNKLYLASKNQMQNITEPPMC